MEKRFNSTGVCVPRKHYMVDISNKLREIKKLIDNEFYFTINRPRQYGKTTTLSELRKALKKDYLVLKVLGITYKNFKYIIDMKIWRGENYHEAGLKQLCDYLDIHDLDKGYLLIFSFNKNKEFKEERVNVQDKDIFQVYV